MTFNVATDDEQAIAIKYYRIRYGSGGSNASAPRPKPVVVDY